MDGIANKEKGMNRACVKYSGLNARQQENYNSAKLSAVLADYGYFTMWLNDDYNGADMIALREGQEALMIQLKSRPFIGKKYRNKGLFMGFPVGEKWCLVEHDKLVIIFTQFGYTESESWKRRGRYGTVCSKKLEGMLEAYFL